MARSEFHRMMSERKEYPRNSLDWQWRTNAARKLVWMMRGVPVINWA